MIMIFIQIEIKSMYDSLIFHQGYAFNTLENY